MNYESRSMPRGDIPAWKIALYGGLAGEALWLASYPLDVVKSKMQTDNLGADKTYKGMSDCFSKTWQKEGMRGFWKGLGPTCLRAMPVSAGTFFVYVFSLFVHLVAYLKYDLPTSVYSVEMTMRAIK